MKRFLIEMTVIGAMFAALLAIHYTPNSYCQAVFHLPCDTTQGR